MIKRELIILFLLPIIMLTACHRDQQAVSQQGELTIQPKSITNHLYFTGNLLPEKQVSVISPNDGVVVAQKFGYGQVVTGGQELFVINSTKQATDFQEALSNYLKSKETLNNSQGNLQNTQLLFDKGLVSRNEYKQARSDYYVNELSFLQSQQQLQQAVKFYRIDKNIFNLSISDIQQINKELKASDAIKNIIVQAPANGIALFPTGNSSSDNTQQKVTVGSEVKQGQLLLTIGHTDSLSMKVQASQIDIDQLKPGLTALVTSMAFPDITLTGYISTIDAQATSEGNSLPVFNMEIVIPKLTMQAKKLVKIGMSAKADVLIEQPKKIIIPIDAVFQFNNNAAVTKIINGHQQTTLIQTGQTTTDGVEVISGLHAGDKIATHH